MIEGADPISRSGALYELSLRSRIPPILLFHNIKGYPDELSRRRSTCARRRCSTTARSGSSWCRTIASTARKTAEPIPPEMVDDRPGAGERAGGRRGRRPRVPGAEVARGRRRPLHRHRMHGDHQGPRQRLGQRRHLSRAGARQEHARRLHRARQARRHHPPEILGAGQALPDGRSAVGQAPVLGAVGASTPGPRRVANSPSPAAGSAGRSTLVKGTHHRHAVPGRCRARVRRLHAAARGGVRAGRPVRRMARLLRLDARPEPVLQVKAIYHRNDPIIIGAPPTQPTLPGIYSAPPARRYSAPPRCGTSWKRPACPASRASGRCRAAARASST